MKNRIALELNLRALKQHLSEIDMILLMLRKSLGVASQTKSRAKRFYIPLKLIPFSHHPTQFFVHNGNVKITIPRSAK